MKIVCPKCKHEHTFRVTVQDYRGFVCSSCHSYFKGEHPDQWIFVKRFAPTDDLQWATLGETITVNRTKYTVVTKIQRLNQTSEYSNEYVGVHEKKSPLYLSDGMDYSCVLGEISGSALKFNKNSGCRFHRTHFQLAYSDRQNVRYAEGFVFEDLERESTTLTYVQSSNEDKLISREYIDNAEEYYKGDYWDKESYCSLFLKYSEYKKRKVAVAKQLFLLGLILVLALGGAFYMLYKPYMKIYEFNFDQKFSSQVASNQFVGEPFLLESPHAQQFKFKGISESNVSNLLLSVKLVNEETNEVYETREIQLFFNDINYASGIDADFCKIPAGMYHFVFETSSTGYAAESISLEEDYKVTFGGISYWPLIVVYVLLIGLIYLYQRRLLSIDYSSILMKEKAMGYFEILKYQKLWLGLILLFVLQFGFYYLVQHATTCRTSTKVSTLEDHTYTGSRIHYYRRTPDDYGSSHK